MINKIKDLFRDGAKNTADFYSTAFASGDKPIYYSEGEEMPRGPNVADVEFGLPKSKLPSGSLKDKAKKFLKKFQTNEETGYANRKAAHDAYMNTLKTMKTGYQRLSGRIGISSSGPRMATKIGQVGRTSNYENSLANWNSRMRKFAVQRYYAQLGKK